MTRFAAFAAAVSSFVSVGASGAHSAAVARNVRTAHFLSASLNNEDHAFSVILPLDYDSSTARYPVLYLLHGYAFDHTAWSTMSNLSAYAAGREMIIVMPDGLKSWYVNSATDAKARYEDYIAKDLVAFVDSHFRTIPLRRARAVAGQSMGGYGAALIGLTHYNEFAAIGILSGALGAAHGGESPANSGPAARRQMEERDARFGKPGSEERKQRDPFDLVTKVPPAAMPMLYIADGGEDPTIKVNHEFVAQLASLGIPYEYREVSPRAHTWDFWDEQIRAFLGKLDSLAGFDAGTGPARRDPLP